MHPFRSVLYMPGSNARALEKAKNLPADALILDLEDAVAPEAKTAARDLIVAAVQAKSLSPRYVIVRVNGLETEWGKGDISAIGACAPDAILIPKVDGPQDIYTALALIDANPNLKNTQIWAMMETPKGILNAAAIATASPRMGGLVLGTNDLIKDMRAHHDPARQAVTAALTTCILAARVANIAVVDGVYNAIKDEPGLLAESEQGRIMGFDGKTLIHPAQIATANAVFGPSDDDIAEAKAFTEAYEAALAEGKAVAVVNGRIVENLHVENARRILALSVAIKELETKVEAPA